MKKIALLLADGFEEIEATTPIDILRRASIKVSVLSISGHKNVKGANGLEILAEDLLDNHVNDDDWDGVVLPGGGDGADRLAKNKRVKSLIQKLHLEEKLIAAICASPAIVLAPLGVIQQRRYTCYPGYEKNVLNTLHARHLEDRLIQDGHIITSKGPGTAVEFALGIVAYLVGIGTAHAIAQQICASTYSIPKEMPLKIS